MKKMRKESNKKSKLSWSESLVRKWFNIKNKPQDFHADYDASQGRDGGERRTSCSERETGGTAKKSSIDYYVRSRSNRPYSQLEQVFKHVGIGAVVGALSRNLGDLEECEGSYLNIYDQNPLAIPKDPIIEMIKATANMLTNLMNFLWFLGQHMLIEQGDTAGSKEQQIAEDKYHIISVMLNLANTFMYMVNTYMAK